MIILQRFEDPAEPSVAAIGGGYGETLLRGVDAVHLRTDGYHVEIGVLLEEESALQTGMDRQHFGFGFEEVDIGFLGDVEKRRRGVGSPSGIPVAVGHFVTSHRERLLNHPFEMVLGGFFGGSLRRIDLYI